VPGAMLSPFGVRRVLNGEPRSRHTGIDLRASKGEPVRAAAAGRVLLAEPFYFEGNLVVLDHGLGLATIYCHLGKINVKEGDEVARGQVIGTAGDSGRATGTHLHFGVRIGDVRFDPLSLLTLFEGAQ
jgi:murein DD-endopeptidase MepM/ murein hydrolase activator NlpD